MYIAKEICTLLRVQNKRLILVGFLVILTIVTGYLFFLRKEQLDRKEKASSLKGEVFAFQNDGNGYLTCKLLTTQIKKNLELLSPDVLILRTTECIYTDKNGEIASVTVPLAFYNKNLGQLYIVNAGIDNGDMPGDGYIDRLIAYVVGPNKDPTVHLYPVTDFSKNDPGFKEFFSTAKIFTDWNKNFVESGNFKFLPKAEKNRIFFISGLTYVLE